MIILFIILAALKVIGIAQMGWDVYICLAIVWLFFKAEAQVRSDAEDRISKLEYEVRTLSAQIEHLSSSNKSYEYDDDY